MILGPMMMLSKRGRKMWFAVRSVVTAIVCIVVAIILHKAAIPALISKGELPESNMSDLTHLVVDNHQWLPWVPVPALILGFAAVVLRPLRGLLVPFAVLASLVAVVVIIGSLIVVMMPMYQSINDLNR
jgi:hypothetical protein